MNKLSEDTLYDLYWNQGLTLKQIGEMHGAYEGTVRKWFKAAGIKRRPIGHNTSTPAMPMPSKQILVTLYHDQRLSMADIGKQLEVSSGTVQKWLHSYGIKTRGRGTNAAEYPEKPSKETLEDLYLSQRLTQRQIASIYGVEHISVGRWLKSYGIPRRAQSRGLDNRGIEPPTSDELYRMVHLENKSYAEIASLYGVDYTAVPHWLTKHGIPKPDVWSTRKKHSGWQPPNKERLYELYIEQGLSTSRIGELLGVEASTVSVWLRGYNIKARTTGYGGKEYKPCLDGHFVRSNYEKRVDDWLYAHGVEHTYEPSLPFGGNHKSDFLANGHYIEVWGMVGEPGYQERRAFKTAEYRKRNMPLIELTPSDFRSDSLKRWERKLSTCLIAPGDALPCQTPLPLHQTPDA